VVSVTTEGPAKGVQKAVSRGLMGAGSRGLPGATKIARPAIVVLPTTSINLINNDKLIQQFANTSHPWHHDELAFR
jgi:hypothetical protein